MIEKIGFIKNPLTVIAIFAGIAEVSGTTVLPFIAAANQQLFIYFLILFPSLLVILFFATLNFNNKVLYAPSDYRDEELFVRVMRYDFKKMQNVEERLLSITDSGKKKIFKPSLPISTNSGLVLPPQLSSRDSQAVKNPDHISIMISNFPNAAQLITLLSKQGYFADLEDTFGREEYTDGLESIWLGRHVPPDHAQKIISIAKDFYPHLIYISISGDYGELPPDWVHNQIYIGGSSESAIKNRCQPLSPDVFKRIQTMDSNKLYEFIRSLYLSAP